jgi:hypothetical protein
VIHARLYDADGRDREIDVEPGIADRVKDRQLLWIDVEGREPADLGVLTSAVGIGDHLRVDWQRNAGGPTSPIREPHSSRTGDHGGRRLGP